MSNLTYCYSFTNRKLNTRKIRRELELNVLEKIKILTEKVSFCCCFALSQTAYHRPLPCFHFLLSGEHFQGKRKSKIYYKNVEKEHFYAYVLVIALLEKCKQNKSLYCVVCLSLTSKIVFLWFAIH